MTRILNPEAIEAESFRIIAEELGEPSFSPDEFALVQRAIHSTADFEFARTLRFALGAIRSGIEAIRAGRSIVADVQMIQAGINKTGLRKFGGEVHCFISDDEVVAAAKEAGLTRAIMSMRKAARQLPGAMYAIGNAPTALLELLKLADEHGRRWWWACRSVSCRPPNRKRSLRRRGFLISRRWAAKGERRWPCQSSTP